MEVTPQVFPKLETFLTENSDVSSVTWTKLLTSISDPNKRVGMHIQLAAFIDWREPFVKATYIISIPGLLSN